MKEMVVVYGSLRQGLHNNPVMGKDAIKLGTCRFDGFIMHSLGGFPCVYKKSKSSVVGEVWVVPPNVLEGSLDRLEGHPDWYRREQVETPYGKAWIYVMHDQRYHDNPVVEHGDWKRYLEERK